MVPKAPDQVVMGALISPRDKQDRHTRSQAHDYYYVHRRGNSRGAAAREPDAPGFALAGSRHNTDNVVHACAPRVSYMYVIGRTPDRKKMSMHACTFMDRQ